MADRAIGPAAATSIDHVCYVARAHQCWRRDRSDKGCCSRRAAIAMHITSLALASSDAGMTAEASNVAARLR